MENNLIRHKENLDVSQKCGKPNLWNWEYDITVVFTVVGWVPNWLTYWRRSQNWSMIWQSMLSSCFVFVCWVQCVLFGTFMIWFASITINLGPTFLSGALAANAESGHNAPSCPLVHGPLRHYVLNLLWIFINVICVGLTLYHLHKVSTGTIISSCFQSTWDSNILIYSNLYRRCTITSESSYCRSLSCNARRCSMYNQSQKYWSLQFFQTI